MTVARRALLAAPLLALPGLAQAQPGWPARPVRVIVPWPPGGGSDILARILAEQMAARLGQPFVVENRSGAGGNLGAEAIARSAPDGYAMGPVTVGGWTFNRFLFERMPYDPARDLQPISLHWEVPNVLVVPAQHVPARNLAEFLAWARTQPRLAYASSGAGTTAHLSGVLFARRAGLDALHVPFRGSAPAIAALLAGDVHFTLDNLSSQLALIQEGRMRAIAVTSARRFPSAPDIPTMEEAGLAGYVVESWSAFAFPAGVPAPVLARASETMRAIAADPAVQDRFLRSGAAIAGSTPEAARARAERETPMWEEMVRLSGARLE